MAAPAASPGQSARSPQLTASLAALAGVLLNEQTVEAILQMLVTTACSAMVAVDGASVSLLRTNKYETTSSTSDEVRDADGVQYQSGRGPCIEASLGRTVNIGLEESRQRWPEFAEAALTRGFRGVLSTPLAVPEQSLGSLNLYSLTRESFNAAEQAAAKVFADQASIVLSNATAFASSELLNEQLREALATRDVIGQAKGVLMVREHCTADEAFDILRRASQHSNRKLRDVAVDFVLSVGSDDQQVG